MSADWFIRWAVIAVIVAVDAIWLRAKGIGIEAKSLAGPLGMAGVFAACCVACSVLARKKPGLSTVLVSTSDYFYSMIQLMLMLLPIVALTYLAASVNLPLADQALVRIDAFLGFDWPAVSGWTSSHPVVADGLRLSYVSIMWQLFIVLFVASVDQPGQANSEFIWNFLVSVLIATGISALVPALGYPGVIGPDHIDALREVRAGAWTTLDFGKMDGIITFPSFHAALGVLLAHSVRRTRWAFWILAPLNAAMILATPPVGGHYLADVIAGLLLAGISIVLVRAIRRRTARARFEWLAWLPGALEPVADQKR